LRQERGRKAGKKGEGRKREREEGRGKRGRKEREAGKGASLGVPWWRGWGSLGLSPALRTKSSSFGMEISHQSISALPCRFTHSQSQTLRGKRRWRM